MPCSRVLNNWSRRSALMNHLRPELMWTLTWLVLVDWFFTAEIMLLTEFFTGSVCLSVVHPRALLGGVMVSALDLRSRGRGFDSWQFHYPSNNSGQVVHTHVRLSPSSIIWYRSKRREGNGSMWERGYD